MDDTGDEMTSIRELIEEAERQLLRTIIKHSSTDSSPGELLLIASNAYKNFKEAKAAS